MTDSSDALERLQIRASETFLKQHEEKHDAHEELASERWQAHESKHNNEQKALDVALEADRARLTDHRVAHDAAHNSHEKLHEAFDSAHKQQHASESEAVKAATSAMDRRLDAMNEFRDQLRDQAATFVRLESFETFREERRHALSQLEDSNDRRFEQLRQLIATEREERRAVEGVKRGMTQTTGIIVGAVGFVGAVLAIVVIFANFTAP